MATNEVVCPKCGELQPPRNLCRACAIDMPRFLAARQAAEEEARASRTALAPSRQASTVIESPAVWQDPIDAELAQRRQQGESATGRVSLIQVIAIALLVALLATLVIRSGWVPILDSANLALHEAGHPLVGLFSHRLGVYGGTIFQLLFPAVVVVHFVRRSHLAGVAIGAIWLGESLHNVARYMADARIQELPLVGGGDHDWTEIFSRWGVLHLDTRIANLTHALGWLLMFGAVVWLFVRYRRGIESVSASND